MSDNEAPKPKITSDIREKNPGRVAAGKKLAAMNRARLARTVGTAGSTQHTASEPHSDNEDCGAETGWGSPMVLLTVIGVVSGLGCLYYTYKQDKRLETSPIPQIGDVSRTSEEPQPSSSSSSSSSSGGGNLKSFD